MPDADDADDADATLLRRGEPVPDVPRAALLHLLLLDTDAAAPQRIELGDTPLRIGRVAGNDLVLAAPEVSRSHCVVTREGDVARITDLGTTNGTYVDGQRIATPTLLAPGATLRLGPFTLHYQRGPRALLTRAAELDRDLERAGRYVAALLPPPITAGPVRVDWRFVPSASIGGDGFGYGPLADDRFCVWLLDVAGHGAGAALLAASAMNALRGQGLADRADPAAVLAALNQNFQMDDHAGLYFSIWYGVFDGRARALRYGVAGQHPAYLTAPGHPAAVPLGTRNPPIGLAANLAFVTSAVHVRPGARLLLFSDGAFETFAPDGTQRGLAELVPLLPRPDDVPGPAADWLLAAIRAVSRPGPFDDDVAILSLDFG